MRPVEFLPERIRQQRARRRRLIRQGYLLTACALALVLLAVLRHGHIAHARAELGQLDERVANVQRQIELIAPLERQMADLLIKKRIDEELGSRADCTAMLAELCRLTPPNMAVASLDFKTVELLPERAPGRDAREAKPPRPGDAVRRVRLVVTGLAPTDVDVANFIGQMSASPLFEDVNMGYTKTVSFAGRSARQFQASCYLAR